MIRENFINNAENLVTDGYNMKCLFILHVLGKCIIYICFLSIHPSGTRKQDRNEPIVAVTTFFSHRNFLYLLREINFP